MTSTAWVVPLAVSGGVGVAVTPVARRLARQVGLVDRPAPHKVHRRVTPYLGGIAIAVAVLAGRLARAPTRLDTVITALAAVLAVIGLLDDDRTLPALPRLGLEVACAAVAVWAGLRISGTGVPGLDVALTVVLLVGITNATNLMDNLDGLAAGVTAAGAAGAGIIAALAGHSGATADAASLVGACLAFLVFNARPASIFMGDAGSLFLGFLLMAVAIRAGDALPGPASLAIPMLIVALPAADTTTVVLARLRHARSPFQGGRDHLSHRLAGTGMGSGPAVALLVGVEVVLATLAVLAARRVLPLWVALAAAAAELLAVLVLAIPVRVYSASPVRLPRLLRWGVPLAVVAAGALAVPAAIGMLRAHRPALAGEVALQDALSAARAGQLSQLPADLAEARQDFAQARSDLAGSLVSAGLAYPVLSTNLDAARTIVDTGLTLSRLGAQLTSSRGDLHLQVHDGTVPLQGLLAAAPGLRFAAASVTGAATRVSHLSRAYLVAPVASAVNRLQRALGIAQRDLGVAAATATYLPPLLGADGPRRYFLAVQNPGESRATGGLIGNWGVLYADQGRLHLESFGRLSQLDDGGSHDRTLQAPATYLARYSEFDPAYDWQNLNMSPDFPTVGSVIANLFPQSGGEPIDGVIAVDPAALQGVLALTGPIDVPGWPVPIDAANVLPVIDHDEYITYLDEAERANFLGDVAQAAFASLKRLDLTDLTALSATLGPLVRQQDIQVYSTHPAEEAYLRQVGVAGAFPPVRSASLAVTTQNVAANKIDFYLRRTIDYQVALAPQGNGGGAPASAQTQAELTLGLDNTAPASGLPPSLIGPYDSQFRAGEEASFVSIYSPLAFQSATLDGTPELLESGTELGRNVYSCYIDIPALHSATLAVTLTGTTRLLPGGWYELDLPHQPGVNPYQVAVTVTVADGWRVIGVRGGTQAGPGEVVAHYAQTEERSLWVQVAPAGG
jgi:UDP-N-acetylmuramyl pentapeptide phosphotransferase/UDP-N-acetylglucosamine-1-phosphate transferase